MLSRQTYIERGVTITALGIAPLLVAALGKPVESLAELSAPLRTLAMLVPGMIVIGILGGLFTYRRKLRGALNWGGMEETAALLKQAAGEFVVGKADNKLIGQAHRATEGQEGRAAGYYCYARIQELRKSETIKRSHSANPVSLGKRILWTLILLICVALYLAWPAAHLLGLSHSVILAAAAALAPITLTALLILGLGITGADGWLVAIGHLRLPKREYKPRLRKREVASAAGNWHKRESGRRIPVIRWVFGLIILTAGGVFFLRNYGDTLLAQFQPLPPPPQVAETTPPPPARPISTPAPKATPAHRAATPPPRRTNPADRQLQAAIDARIPSNGILITANLDELAFAGWDARHLDTVLAGYKRDRLDEWYQIYLQRTPFARGKVVFRVTLLAQGRVGEVRKISSDLADDFVYGLIDRLQAMDLGSSALDPVTIVLAMDFQP